jgi:hypothetical protein
VEPCEQFNHRCVGRQHVDAVFKQATVGHGACQVTLPGQQLAQHGDLGVVLACGRHARVALAARLFVGPVRGHAMLGMFVHGLGTDLDFDRAALLVAHDGVQRLVTVGLGLGDVVVKLFHDGGELLMHPAQGGIAVLHGGHHHAQGAQVQHLVKVQRLAPHLLDDAVDVLGPALHRGADAAAAQFRLQPLAQLLHVHSRSPRFSSSRRATSL